MAFSEDSLRDMHNADLSDTTGNLVHRATNLAQKFCDGVVPDVPPPSSFPFDLGELCDEYIDKMENFELQGGASIAIQGFRDINRYLTEEAPWLKKGEEHSEARQITVRATLEGIYALSHLLAPFLPIGASNVFKKLNTEPKTLATLSRDCRNLVVGTEINVGDVLYSKVSALCLGALRSLFSALTSICAFS
jgi:methionyl-tRNA synthetase